jgi:hypothetical protein
LFLFREIFTCCWNTLQTAPVAHRRRCAHRRRAVSSPPSPGNLRMTLPRCHTHPETRWCLVPYPLGIPLGAPRC